MLENNNQDELLSKIPSAKEGEVSEIEILALAKWILIAVAVIYIGSALSELWRHGNPVFETCKITLPSIATLVIGYYFGSTK